MRGRAASCGAKNSKPSPDVTAPTTSTTGSRTSPTPSVATLLVAVSARATPLLHIRGADIGWCGH